MRTPRLGPQAEGLLVALRDAASGEESVIQLGSARGVVTLRGSEVGGVREMVVELVRSLRALGIDARADDATGQIIHLRLDSEIDRGLITGCTDLSLDQTSCVRLPEVEAPD